VRFVSVGGVRRIGRDRRAGTLATAGSVLVAGTGDRELLTGEMGGEWMTLTVVRLIKEVEERERKGDDDCLIV